MEQSTELKDLILRNYEALSSGDYSFFERHVSHEDGVLAIGTDPSEWWEGYATIVQVFKAQMEEMGGFQLLVDAPQAYSSSDSFGWGAGSPKLKLPDGTEIPLRMTMVFRKEQDEWKIVQIHLSIGIQNEDAIGEELTT